MSNSKLPPKTLLLFVLVSSSSVFITSIEPQSPKENDMYKMNARTHWNRRFFSPRIQITQFSEQFWKLQYNSSTEQTLEQNFHWRQLGVYKLLNRIKLSDQLSVYTLLILVFGVFLGQSLFSTIFLCTNSESIFWKGQSMPVFLVSFQ
jgi:hypothetical protein